jgi:uncharacterized protein YwqG
MTALNQEHGERLGQLIAKHDLTVVEDVIRAHATECIILDLGDLEKYAKTGNSRYGGIPDLPPSIDWPESEGMYYGFLMQLNLAELPSIQNHPLPSSGMLYFFIDDDEDATDVIAKVVFYQGDMADLRPTAPPDVEKLSIQVQEQYSNLTAHELSARVSIDLPGYGSSVYFKIEQAADKTDEGDGGDRYRNLLEEAIEDPCDDSIGGKLLGLASEVNDDMRVNAVLVKSHRDRQLYDYEYRKAHEAELSKAAEEWRLLWRIDTNFKVGINIWDAGSFYLMIRKDDLASLNFDDIYIQLETG